MDGLKMENMHTEPTLAAILDDPDFAGIECQNWHVTGDERQPYGNSQFFPKSTTNPEILHRLLQRGDGSDPTFSAHALYSRKGPVVAWMHPVCDLVSTDPHAYTGLTAGPPRALIFQL